MAGARLILCEVLEDRDSFYGRLKLLPNVPTATADKTGRFQFQGFAPGTHTIIYSPAGADVMMPTEISIKSLEAVTRSIAPLLRNTELGKNDPYAPRPWGPQLTLLKGHTFWSDGANMKIWNATLRRGQQGPYLEVRRGLIWLLRLEDKSEIKFDAWSF